MERGTDGQSARVRAGDISQLHRPRAAAGADQACAQGCRPAEGELRGGGGGAGRLGGGPGRRGGGGGREPGAGVAAAGAGGAAGEDVRGLCGVPRDHRDGAAGRLRLVGHGFRRRGRAARRRGGHRRQPEHGGFRVVRGAERDDGDRGPGRVGGAGVLGGGMPHRAELLIFPPSTCPQKSETSRTAPRRSSLFAAWLQTIHSASRASR